MGEDVYQGLQPMWGRSEQADIISKGKMVKGDFVQIEPNIVVQGLESPDDDEVEENARKRVTLFNTLEGVDHTGLTTGNSQLRIRFPVEGTNVRKKMQRDSRTSASKEERLVRHRVESFAYIQER